MIESENPEIVITDMKMPVMDGKELLATLHEKQVDCKVIVVSGFSDYDFTRQAIRSNVIDYILKPVDEQELNEALSQAVCEIEDKRHANTLTDVPEEELQSNITIEIERYIRKNYCSDISLNHLARIFYVSKEHISRSFKNSFKLICSITLHLYELKRRKRFC